MTKTNPEVTIGIFIVILTVTIVYMLIEFGSVINTTTFQNWASIAIILQSIFMLILVYLTNQYSKATKQYAVTTEKMLNETENYVITTEEIFQASIIDRQIHFYEKRLEQLYMPIYNNDKLFEYLPNSFNEFEAMGIDNFIIKIKPYTYLADDPLQSNLEELLKECGTTFSGNGDSEKIRQSEKYINLKKEILRQLFHIEVEKQWIIQLRIWVLVLDVILLKQGFMEE